MAFTLSGDVATTRTNLGLGDAATKTTGTAAGNIPVLDSSGKIADAQLAALAASKLTGIKTVGGVSIAGSGDIATLPSGGSVGQVIKKDGSNNPGWAADEGGKVVKMQHFTNGTRSTSVSCSQGDFWTVTYNKLMGSGVSKLIVEVSAYIHGPSNGNSGEYITIGGSQYGSFSYSYGGMSAYTDGNAEAHGIAEKTTQAAGNVTVGWGCSTSAGGNMCEVINPNSTDDARNNQKTSTITVWEILI